MQKVLLVADTSGKQGSVALVFAGEGAEPNKIEVKEAAALVGGTFSAQLVPQIATLLAKHGLRKTNIDGFVVVSGPGSFTGLRVGLAAVKALAEILQKPIVAVSLLEILAVESGIRGKVVAALDGGRGEVFFAAYGIAADSVELLREELLSKADFLSGAQGSTVATSDAALAAAARDAGLSVAAVEPVSAEMIARFGWKKLQAGKTVLPEELEANYMRRSDAEMFVKRSF